MVTLIIQTRATMMWRQMTNPILSLTLVLRLQKGQSTRMWVAHQILPDRFGQHGSQWNRPKRGCWRPLQWKVGGIKMTRYSGTEWVNMVSPGSIRCLTNNFIWRDIMGEDWAVACGYLILNRSIAAEMYNLAHYLNFWRMKVTHKRRLLTSALPKCQVSILLKGKFKWLFIQFSIATVIDKTIHDNKHQQFLVL